MSYNKTQQKLAAVFRPNLNKTSISNVQNLQPGFCLSASNSLGKSGISAVQLTNLNQNKDQSSVEVVTNEDFARKVRQQQKLSKSSFMLKNQFHISGKVNECKFKVMGTSVPKPEDSKISDGRLNQKSINSENKTFIRPNADSKVTLAPLYQESVNIVALSFDRHPFEQEKYS